MRLDDVWSWSGKIGRTDYVKWGCSLMALKLLLDWLISTAYEQPWSPLFYVMPEHGFEGVGISGDDYYYHRMMLVASLPFLWAGVVLTVKRLRSAGWSPVWVVLFMVPVVNLAFFLFLTLLRETASPAQEEEEHVSPMDRFIPGDPLGAALAATLVSIPIAVPLVVLAAQTFETYGWSLFFLVPFFVGLVSAAIWGYYCERSTASTFWVCTLSCLTTGTVLLGLGIEGVVCLAMAAPIVLPTAFLGAGVGLTLTRSWRNKRQRIRAGITPLFILPMIMGAEGTTIPEPPTVAVSTTIEIDAPVENVWPYVVGFPEIEEPEGWIFRAGIASPVHAEISGTGVGAVRRCVFTTGSFIEPIEVWDEPELLRFGVVDNPAPMREWSPFGEIDTAHLKDNFVAVRGEFRLERLPSGGTRLIGTTWYRQYLWPSFYWRLWADEIVHAIHMRVLRHIKRLSEV